MASGPAAGGIGELLAAFTSPDNGVRRRAEAAWEDIKMRLPDQVCGLFCVVAWASGTYRFKWYRRHVCGTGGLARDSITTADAE